MTSTKTRRPRKPEPNHELKHGYFRGTRPHEETSPDGGLYIYHALAFSTLLSSQETDAHLWRKFPSPPGQPLNFTLGFLPCQLGFRRLSGRLLADTETPWSPWFSPVSLVTTVTSTAGARETFGSWILSGSPGPGPPSGVPSPTGQDELYVWCGATSNRELYPRGAPVLTWTNGIGADDSGVSGDACAPMRQ